MSLPIERDVQVLEHFCPVSLLFLAFSCKYVIRSRIGPYELLIG